MNITVIGGGASGLAAAITAAEQGAQVTLLEQNKKPGAKLSITGNGRGNLANAASLTGAYNGEDASFADKVFKNVPPGCVMDFFRHCGIVTRKEGELIYPYSGEAPAVTKSLIRRAELTGVKIKNNEKVISVKRKEQGFDVITSSWKYSCDKVIIACGSAASAVEGADGSGYDLAKSFGHKIIKPLPALAPLLCESLNGRKIGGWAGVRINGTVSLYIDGALVKKEKGQIQLANYGISGICVFNISSPAGRAVNAGKDVKVVLDFAPDFSWEEIVEMIDKTIDKTIDETIDKKKKGMTGIREALTSFMPEKLIPILMDGAENVESLARNMKGYELKVNGTSSFDHAQVASGGVSTAEVGPDTLESRKEKGLYFCGEILDIDGRCGGFNLEFAFATGILAGKCASKT